MKKGLKKKNPTGKEKNSLDIQKSNGGKMFGIQLISHFYIQTRYRTPLASVSESTPTCYETWLNPSFILDLPSVGI